MELKLETEDQIFSKYVSMLFERDAGFVIDEDYEEDDNAVYGETTWSGIKKIIRNIDINDKDVFFDFGSGIGKIVFQFYIMTKVKAAYGIELIEPRHKKASRALKTMQAEIPDLFWDKRPVKFFNKSFYDVNLKNATIIYACLTCFDDKTLRKIGALSNKSKNLRYLITLDPVPNTKLTLDQVLKIRCSWDRSTKCYIYAQG